MIAYILLLALVLSASLSLFYVSKTAKLAYKRELFDIPNKRKVHHERIPRLGGIAFVPSLAISFLFSLAIVVKFDIVALPKPVLIDFCALTIGVIIMLFMGIYDDLLEVHYYYKFIVQLLAALLLPLSGLWINNLYGLFGFHAISSFIGIPLTVLLIIFTVNAINLIDGIDGLASGIAIVGFSVLGFLFFEKELWLYALLSFCAIGLLIPFFFFNVFGKVKDQKKIFMGDGGSLVLGYILVFMAIRYACVNPQFTSFSQGALLLAFSSIMLPILDVLQVILIRLKNKKPLFSGDNTSHIHHRFMNMGLSPIITLVVILLLSYLFALINFLLVCTININLLLLLNLLLWVLINCVVSVLVKLVVKRKVKK